MGLGSEQFTMPTYSQNDSNLASLDWGPEDWREVIGVLNK